MNTVIKQTIIDLALATPDVEVCGLIYQSGPLVQVYPCVNISQDDEGTARSFEIDPQDYIAARQLGTLLGVYHSHSTGGSTTFSEADLDLARELGLPFYLYVVDSNLWLSDTPESYQVPLSGREWCWGVSDCLETIRIYYRQVKGVHITDYDRDETFEGAAASAITQYVDTEGFVPVPGNGPIKVDDVLLFRTPGSAYPHHLGVFLGQGRLLHHPRGGLSRVDHLDGAWLKRLAMVLRYEGKPL